MKKTNIKYIDIYMKSIIIISLFNLSKLYEEFQTKNTK